MRRLVAIGIGLTVMAVLAACGGDDPADPTATTVTATPTPSPVATERTTSATPSPSVEEEIASAYLAYWDAYADALLNLDASRMEGTAEGEELARISEEIDGLSLDGVALRVVVEHDFAVVEAGAESARVVDRYVDRSFAVDPETKAPATADVPGTVATDSYELQRDEAANWVVVSSRRFE